MKKFLAILLALSLSLTCFAACGSNPGNSSTAGDASTAGGESSTASTDDPSTNNGDLPTI